MKGLEPEIQRLIAKHKAEIKKIKSIHEAELLESDERAGQRYVAMTEELRDQLAKEKEAACARERELARSTYVCVGCIETRACKIHVCMGGLHGNESLRLPHVCVVCMEMRADKI